MAKIYCKIHFRARKNIRDFMLCSSEGLWAARPATVLAKDTVRKDNRIAKANTFKQAHHFWPGAAFLFQIKLSDGFKIRWKYSDFE